MQSDKHNFVVVACSVARQAIRLAKEEGFLHKAEGAVRVRNNIVKLYGNVLEPSREVEEVWFPKI